MRRRILTILLKRRRNNIGKRIWLQFIFNDGFNITSSTKDSLRRPITAVCGIKTRRMSLRFASTRLEPLNSFFPGSKRGQGCTGKQTLYNIRYLLRPYRRKGRESREVKCSRFMLRPSPLSSAAPGESWSLK